MSKRRNKSRLTKADVTGELLICSENMRIPRKLKKCIKQHIGRNAMLFALWSGSFHFTTKTALLLAYRDFFMRPRKFTMTGNWNFRV